MTGYEQDFIYKVLPRLTNAIEGLTKEIKRYNDSKDRDIEMEWIDDVISDDNRDDIPIQVQVCPKCKTFFPLSQTGGGHHFCPACGQKFKVKEVSDG